MGALKKEKPDPILVRDQLQALQESFRIWGPSRFLQYTIWILTKKEDARLKEKGRALTRLVPFTVNPIQQQIENVLASRNIILKARQVGVTTWVLCRRIFVPTILAPGTNGFLISQNSTKASEHFRMVRRAKTLFGAVDPANMAANDLCLSLQDNLLHTTYSSRKELVFDQLDSTITIGSAEIEEAGQGVTLHRVACSEVARWPGNAEETLANLKEALIVDGTLDLESTANGGVGYFYEECMRAERGASEFKYHFHPWWDEPSYALPTTAEEIGDLESDEAALVKAFHLSLQQIAFRRAKKLSLRHNFEEKYPEDGQTCFLMQGSSFFDRDIVRQRMLELMNFTPVASFSNGQARVFKKRIIGRKYVIGADTASGKMPDKSSPDDAKRDFSAAKVLDLETGEEVASYMAQLSPVDFALDLVYLGNYYNTAMIAVERGTASEAAEGGTTILTLVEQGYPQIYKHKEWWKRGQTKTVVELEGFPTTKRTRPVAVNKLKWFLEEYPELFWDKTLLKQMSVFVRNAKGTPAAQEGAHDDMVLASAIAHCVRLILLNYIDPVSMRSEKYGQSDAPEDED